MIIYEDNDFIITCSDTNFDKFVIFLNSAAGLDRIVLSGVQKAHDKLDTVPNGIYIPFNITEINFLCKNANWYQRSTVKYCVSVIKKIITGYEKNTIIYGSSMGGFGAIHFGAELGVTSVAFSPQVSLEEEFGLAESWKKVAEYTQYHYGTFKSNILDGKCTKAPIYMFYDGSHILDKKHASYIIKHYKNCTAFNIPYGGHACSGSVNHIYRIKRIIIEILNHEFDVEKFRAEFFQNYNKEEQKKESAWSRFKYLYNIVPEHNFYVKLCIIRSKNYFDLCVGVCHILEVNFPEYLEECLSCLVDDKKILSHIVNMGKIGERDKLLENSYTRKKVCALFYYNRKQYAKAEILYHFLYGLDKHNVDISGNLAIAIYKQGRKHEALDIIFRHIEINGRDVQNMTFLGRIYFESRDYKEARRWLSLSFSYNLWGKSIVSNRILYARSLKEEGKVVEAVEYLKQHLKMGQESGDYLAHLGAYSVMTGHPEEGLSFLDQSKKKKNYPPWTDAWIHKAHEISKKNHFLDTN